MAGRAEPLTAVAGPTGGDEAFLPTMAWRSLHLMCRRSLARNVDLQVEGLEHVPATGPVLIAARHFHHLYDGCAIGTVLPRHIHILVAMDWVGSGMGRRAFARACRAARFPVVVRSGAVEARPELREEAARALRQAASETVGLLREGHVVLVFPEGYPNVDPGYTPKEDDGAWLPFEPGFARLVALAERDGRTRVPVVPAGVAYTRGQRWGLTLRFGEALFLADGDRDGFVREVEGRVRALSGVGTGIATP